ncbi:putative cGMP-dependent protein kinase interacting domain-containing protein [Seiridium cardinale]
MPDVNSIPPSPSTTRRPSTNLPGQTQPHIATQLADSSSPTLNILPSNQQSYHQSVSGSLPSPPLPSAVTASMPPPPASGQDNTGVGAGPGPIRHPRPLTAAELHQQLEAEQELLVNRLTRDLQTLRAAHNSSVASNASSASASTTADQPQSSFVDTHLLSGPGFPLPTTSADRRHQRTSSSTSARSFSHMASAGSTPAPIPISNPPSGNPGSVLEAARNPRNSMSMSRQNSTTSHRSASRSRNRSPHPHGGPGSYTQSHGFPQGDHPPGAGYFPRSHPTSTPHSTAATPGTELSPGLLPATVRYEETAFFRQELDNAKRENDTLKKRIKELEKMVRERRESDASRTSGGGARIRSESTSTTASVSVSVSGAAGVGGGGTNIAGGRRDPPGRAGMGMERAFSTLSVAGSVGVGVPDEELQVGESASSVGIKSQEQK